MVEATGAIASGYYYYRHSSGGDSIGIWVAIIAVFIVIGVLFAIFNKGARTKRMLRNMPVTPIGRLADDTLGRVVGRAQGEGNVLNGPLTGRPCVYYIAVVEQQHSTGRSSYWKTLIREVRATQFRLVDDTGYAIVDPSHAQVLLDFDGNSSSGTFDKANPIEEAFLTRHGHQSKGWMFNKTLRYREAMIEIGEAITILGSGVREPDPEQSGQERVGGGGEAYRSAPPTRLRLTGSPKFQLVICDDKTTTAARPAA
jgi:hypothetical protein